jgi:ferric-dicitrate binding protein FerR (iron transport regulator)
MSEFDKHTLSAWGAGEPPADFADRVIAARDAEAGEPAPVAVDVPPPRGANPRWLKQSAVVVALASAAVFAFALMRGRSIPSVSGSLQATQRETVSLGQRGVAVAEPGAHITWKVEGGAGRANVTQSDGAVFYRVERGGPFVVHTPAGDVTVLGTCFSVEVLPMKPSKQSVTGAAVGAAVTATVLLTVYEGRVLFANDGSETEVAAGQSASARVGGGAPSPG